LVSEDFTLPNDLIVDLVMPVNTGVTPEVDPTLFHVSRIGVFSAGIVIVLAYNGSDFATVNVASATFTKYKTYSFTGINEYFDVRGWITIGDIAKTLESPGSWNFTAATAGLEPTVVRPNLRAITSMRVANGDDVSAALSGDLVLVAGNNIRFRLGEVSGNPAIIIDAVTGPDYQEECDCSDLNELSPPIRSINGVTPDEAGNITIQGSDCLDLSAGTASITITDSCADPCCGCAELEVITDTLAAVQNQMQTLQNTADRLDEVITTTRVNLLASKSTGVPPDYSASS
jgi:hypothetical protein